jgi:hypothetical protein
MADKKITRFSKATSLVLCGLGYLAAFAAASAVAYLLRDRPTIEILAFADLAATIVIFVFSFLSDNSSFYDPYWSVAPVRNRSDGLHPRVGGATHVELDKAVAGIRRRRLPVFGFQEKLGEMVLGREFLRFSHFSDRGSVSRVTAGFPRVRSKDERVQYYGRDRDRHHRSRDSDRIGSGSKALEIQETEQTEGPSTRQGPLAMVQAPELLRRNTLLVRYPGFFRRSGDTRGVDARRSGRYDTSLYMHQRSA